MQNFIERSSPPSFLKKRLYEHAFLAGLREERKTSKNRGGNSAGIFYFLKNIEFIICAGGASLRLFLIEM